MRLKTLFLSSCCVYSFTKAACKQNNKAMHATLRRVPAQLGLHLNRIPVFMYTANHASCISSTTSMFSSRFSTKSFLDSHVVVEPVAPVCDEDDFDAEDSHGDDDTGSETDSKEILGRELPTRFVLDDSSLQLPAMRIKPVLKSVTAKAKLPKKKPPKPAPKIPIALNEKEIEEKFVRGSGPGGQNVNKSNNCVQLLHLPTGTSVSCHETRELTANRKIARRWLIEKLDLLLNGAESKIAKQQEKLRRRKKKADSRSKKKYGSRTDNTVDEVE